MPAGTIWLSLGRSALRRDQAIVAVEWFLGLTGGAGYQHRLVGDGDRWKVFKAKMH